jgi:DedD protein
MDQALKQRLVGASVLVALAVIFVPMFFTDTEPTKPSWEGSPIPPKPKVSADEKYYPLDEDYFAGLEKALPSAQTQARTPAAAETERAVKPIVPSQAPPASVEQPKKPAVDRPAQPAEKPKPGSKTESKTAPKTEQGPAPDKSAKPPVLAMAEPQKPAMGGAAPSLSPAQPKSAPETPERVGVTAWAIQLGSFTSEENAKLLETKLRERGYHAFLDRIYVKDAKVYRVRVGPELQEAKIKELQARLEREINLKGIVVRYP